MNMLIVNKELMQFRDTIMQVIHVIEWRKIDM